MIDTMITLKNNKRAIIREAVEADAADCISYVNRVAGETDNLTFGLNEFGFTLEKEIEFIKSSAQAKNGLMLIARVDGEMAALANMRGADLKRLEHIAEFGITVLKKFWGCGLGAAISEQVLTWAKQSGVIRKINLKARSDNQNAIDLYRKLGFTTVGTITRDFFINGKFYDNIFMEIEID